MIVTERWGIAEGTIELRPNSSLSWRGNLYLVGVIAAVNAIIAIGFALVGAWPVLPFAGLEVFCVFCGIYYVARQSQRREYIFFKPSAIHIERGLKRAESRYNLARADTYISVTPGEKPMDLARVALCEKLHEESQNVSIGEFLNKNDLKTLIAELENFGLRARYREDGQRTF